MADFKALILDAGVHKQIAGADYLNPGGGLLMAAGPGTLSGANTGRLQYVAGASQRFEVSANGGAYVPLVTGAGTLADSYDHGTLAAHQTMTLTDAHGGGVLVDATSVGFTGANALSIAGTAGSSVVFRRIGGVSMASVQTIAAPVAISTWDALLVDTSTLTLTAGGVVPNELALVRFKAPTITQTAGVAYTVPVAATVIIDGPPAAGAGGGATPTLTAPLSLYVKSGNVTCASALFTIANNQNADTLHLVSNTTSGTSSRAIGQIASSAGSLYLESVSAAYTAVPLWASSSVVATDWPTLFITCLPGTGAIRFYAAGNVTETARMNANHNLLLGTTTDAAATRLNVLATKSVVSAAGAVWDGVKFAASTLTLTGAVTPVTALSFHTIEAPTITSASAITVASAATVTIQGPPVAAGSVTVTNPASLRVVLGNSLFPRIGAGLVVNPKVSVHVSATSSDNSVMALGTPSGVFGITASPTAGQGYGLFAGVLSTDGDAWIQVGRIDGSAVAYNLGLQASGGNVVIGGTASGATASKTLALSNSATAPSASADLCHLYCADIAAGQATLAIYAEEAVAADVGLASTHSFITFINGVKYKLMLVAA